MLHADQPKQRLLVIGTNPGLANTLFNHLRAEGIALQSRAVEPADALCEQLTEFVPDLILLMNGSRLSIQACLKAMADTCTKAAFVVANNDESADQYLLHAGVNDLVTGSDPLRLKLRLQQWLSLLRLRRKYQLLSSFHRELQTRHLLLLESTQDCIAYLHQGTHIYCNKAYAELFGSPEPRSLQNTPLLELITGKDKPRVNRFLQKDIKVPVRMGVNVQPAGGGIQNVDMCFTPIRYRQRYCLQLYMRPAGGNRQYARRLTNLKRRDLLTRLLNADYFHYRLENAIHRAVKRDGNSFLLLVLIDRFPEIKAAAGLADTNLIITDISRFLRESVKKTFIAARLSENEFALLLKNDDPDEALDLAKFIREKISNHITPAIPPSLTLSCTLGIAAINEQALDARELIQRARANLGAPLEGSRYHLYHGESPIRHLREISEEVSQAIKHRRAGMLYQPLVNLHNEHEHNYRIIPYLHDSAGNEISADRFMPSVMLNNLDDVMDRIIIEQCLTNIHAGDENLRLFVNLGAGTLLSQTFLPWLSEKMASMRFPGRYLTFSVNEFHYSQNPLPVLEFIRGLGELNLQCALTHFGCTPGHEEYLDRIQPACVMPDQCLIRDLVCNGRQRRSLKSMINALHARGCQVVSPESAESDQLPVLWSLGIDLVQGLCRQGAGKQMNFDFPRQRVITQSVLGKL